MKKIAVIGAGKWGIHLVKTFFELGQLDAVADPDPDTCKSLRHTYPDLPVYQDAHEILSSAVPAIVIATPAPTHFSIAKAALEAGKDVFIEKPMTLSSSHAEELVRIAEDRGLIVMAGHLLLYQPAVQWMKTYIESGGIGQLHSLHQYRLKLGRVRSVENVLWSLGVHDIAVILYMTGRIPEEIDVSGHSILQPQIEDDIHLHMIFSGGVQAHLHTSWLWPSQERRLVIRGSLGMLEYDEMKQTVTLHRKGIHRDLSIRDEGAEIIFQGNAEPLQLECIHFLICIMGRTKPLSDGNNGLEVVRILEKATRLLKKGVMI